MPKKRKKEYTAAVAMNPFFYEVTIVLTDDYNGKVDELQLGQDFYDKAGVSIGFGDYHMVIFDTTCIDNGVIAHESAHCVFDTLASAGQDPVQGEETFTYLLQHLVNVVHAMCKKHKITIR